MLSSYLRLVTSLQEQYNKNQQVNYKQTKLINHNNKRKHREVYPIQMQASIGRGQSTYLLTTASKAFKAIWLQTLGEPNYIEKMNIKNGIKSGKRYIGKKWEEGGEAIN